jgi:hypothetical protein
LFTHLRAIIKQLGAVPSLEEERLSNSHVRELTPEPVDLGIGAISMASW